MQPSPQRTELLGNISRSRKVAENLEQALGCGEAGMWATEPERLGPGSDPSSRLHSLDQGALSRGPTSRIGEPQELVRNAEATESASAF